MPFFVPRRYLGFLHEQVDAKDARIAYLEQALDTLHAQATGAPLPAEPEGEPPALPPLPPEIEAELAGMEDPERRAEAAEYARWAIRNNPSQDIHVLAASLVD